MTLLKYYSASKVGYYKHKVFKLAMIKIWFFVSVMVLLTTFTFLY